MAARPRLTARLIAPSAEDFSMARRWLARSTQRLIAPALPIWCSGGGSRSGIPRARHASTAEARFPRLRLSIRGRLRRRGSHHSAPEIEDSILTARGLKGVEQLVVAPPGDGRAAAVRAVIPVVEGEIHIGRNHLAQDVSAAATPHEVRSRASPQCRQARETVQAS
jgi:hypothetical protein